MASEEDASLWLKLGIYDGTPVLSDERVLVTGLEFSDEHSLIREALGAESTAPSVLICEGSPLDSLDGRAVLHYDMTGTCSVRHPHVVWDPARFPMGVITVLAAELLHAAADPNGTWTAPAAPGQDLTQNYASQVRPDLFTALPVMSEVLWAAGAAGHGIREAMDWLASDGLADVAAYCRSMAGPDPPPLIELSEAVLAGPAHTRQEAVYLAWQALAPVEEVMRQSAALDEVRPLEVTSWLEAGSVLAISLPAGATAAHQQIACGVVLSAHQLQVHAETQRGRTYDNMQVTHTPCVWRGVARPRRWEWNKNGARALVSAASGSQAAAWAGSHMRHDLLLGARADEESLSVARQITGLTVTAPPSGEVILIRNATQTVLSAPSADPLGAHA